VADLLITADEAIAWLTDYKRAWETRDADLIVALFTPDGLYQESRFIAPFEGAAGIRRYWDEDVVARQREIDFEFDLWAVNGAIAYAGWRTRFMDLKHGTRRRLDGVFRLTFASRAERGLLCARLDEWWDIAPEDAKV
jgi:ketosteroid isomerase-like protein